MLMYYYDSRTMYRNGTGGMLYILSLNLKQKVVHPLMNSLYICRSGHMFVLPN